MVPFILLFLMSMCCGPLYAQHTDTLPDNLVHPPGYLTADWGTIQWEKTGSGVSSAIFLPGWGFDGSSFRSFFETEMPGYTVYLLTLPGFGTSRAYAMPPAGTSYGDGNWMKGVEQAILQLVASERLVKPALIGHFAVSGHIAMKLATEHPEIFGKVALIGVPARLTFQPPYDTLSTAGRVQAVDRSLAPRWFKTVSRETWLKGNFIPATYSLDSLRAGQRFKEANESPLPVQIGYLCEYWAADFDSYLRTRIPVLALIPSFSEPLLADLKLFYLKWWTSAWDTLAQKNPAIRLERIPGSAANIMDDQPVAVGRLLRAFLN